MAGPKDPIIIKKYANRRLYNTGTSSYVTLDDLAEMVRRGEDFVVRDARTGEDLTRTVLTQIIFDAESRGNSLLPTTFLRQLIRFYGDSMQTLVPPFLEHSLSNFVREQERLKAQMESAFGINAVQAMEEQARRNMELFERSMRMFMPFAPPADSADKPRGAAGAPEPEGPAAPAARSVGGDLDELRSQIAAMQARINQLASDAPNDIRTAAGAARPAGEPPEGLPGAAGRDDDANPDDAIGGDVPPGEAGGPAPDQGRDGDAPDEDGLSGDGKPGIAGAGGTR